VVDEVELVKGKSGEAQTIIAAVMQRTIAASSGKSADGMPPSIRFVAQILPFLWGRSCDRA